MNAVDPGTAAVAEGLFAGAGEQAHLLGTLCRGCGAHYFPRSLSCRNPRCEDKHLEQIALSRRGRLYSYTVQHYRPPPLFRREPWKPYALGVIELPENIRVIALLADVEFEALCIDLPMELTVIPLYHDEQGRAVLTYAFRPQASQDSAS
jgi:uncharacterized OB-fold protein